MAKVSTYLNFRGDTAAAFEFYKSVFGTEYAGPIMRLGDVPPSPDGPPVSDADRDLVMHVALPILAGHLIMGTDVTDEWAEGFVVGSNVSIMLSPDTKAEADDLFAKLSAGGSDLVEMQDMFWGDYFGSFCDRFGVRWMLNVVGQHG